MDIQKLNRKRSQPRRTSNHITKRKLTAHACAECKRRKVRCDGKQPCDRCIGYGPTIKCYYAKHKQRFIPSRRTMETLGHSLEECTTILERLYPNRDLTTLLSLTKPELLDLLEDRPCKAVGSNSTLSHLDIPVHSDESYHRTQFVAADDVVLHHEQNEKAQSLGSFMNADSQTLQQYTMYQPYMPTDENGMVMTVDEVIGVWPRNNMLCESRQKECDALLNEIFYDMASSHQVISSTEMWQKNTTT